MSECRCKEFESIPRTWSEIESRLPSADAIRATLESLAWNPQTWMRTYRCRVCGRSWAGEYPFSEHHGGGPELLYRIEVVNPLVWLETARSFSAGVRGAEEDRRFFESLGPELGPENCREPGCTHRRINPGLFCRCHHFEMVMRRPCPFWDRATAG